MDGKSKYRKARQEGNGKRIEKALSLKGTYYLPYRLHTTKEQLYRAYPQARKIFNLKRKYDTAEIFQNWFYQAYSK